MEIQRTPRLAAYGTLALATSCAHLLPPENAELAAPTKAARSLVMGLGLFSEGQPSCYEVDRTVESVLFDAGAQQQSSQQPRHGEAMSGPALNPHAARSYEFPDSQGRITVELVGITEDVGAHAIRVVFQSPEGFSGTVEQQCEMHHPATRDGMRWK